MAEEASKINSFNKKPGEMGGRASLQPISRILFQPPDTPQLGTGAPGAETLMSTVRLV